MLRRTMAILLVVLIAVGGGTIGGAAFAQDATPSPSPTGDAATGEEREPTEYFAYLAVALFLLLLLFIGGTYIRSAMKRAET